MTVSRAGRVPWEALAVIAIVGLVVAVAAVVPRFPKSERRSRCIRNVTELGERFLAALEGHRFDPTLHGSAQILSWFGPDGLPEGDERLLICPGDQVMYPETRDDARVYHPADAAALRRTRGLGSYAVRDFEKFPLAEDATEKQAILCDRQGEDGRTMHHADAIVVCFSDGDAQILSHEELGFAPDEPIVVGPESPSAMLRVFERP